jgi:hypothetical protein
MGWRGAWDHQWENRSFAFAFNCTSEQRRASISIRRKACPKEK